VAGRHVRQRGGGRVQQDVDEREELAGVSVPIELLVQAVGDLGGGRGSAGGGVDQDGVGVGGRRERPGGGDGQQRRGHAVAAHVQHVQPVLVAAERTHVQEVAGQVLARLVGPGDGEPRHGGQLRRQVRLLDLGRRLEVGVLPLVGRHQLGVGPLQFTVAVAEGLLQVEHLLDRPLQQQLRLRPGQQDLEVERLGDVVVGAQGEGADDVLGLVLGGGHDDRQLRRRVRPADALQHLQPAHAGHHHVQQDQVERGLDGDQVQGRLPVLGRDRDVPVPGEAAGEHLAVGLDVVDDQHAHLRGVGRDGVRGGVGGNVGHGGLTARSGDGQKRNLTRRHGDTEKQDRAEAACDGQCRCRATAGAGA
jgi:hypothetical protein